MISETPVKPVELEGILGALPIPAYACDLHGVLTWQNEASLAAVGDLIGLHYTQMVPPDELARARETWAAVTLGGSSRRRTGVYRSASGELVKLESIVAPMRVDGRITGLFGVALPSEAVPEGSPATELSPRQLDVLRLLVQAKTTDQIAAELHLAPETIRNHIGRLLKSLGARSRLEAIVIALRDGLVSLDLDEDPRTGPD